MNVKDWRRLPDGWHRGWVLGCPSCRKFGVLNGETVVIAMTKDGVSQMEKDPLGLCSGCQTPMRFLYGRWQFQLAGVRCS